MALSHGRSLPPHRLPIIVGLSGDAFLAQASDDPFIGQTVNRNFKIEKLLGVGGMGALAPSLDALAAYGLTAGQTGTRARAAYGRGGYGPLVQAGPELALPEDFRYVKFGVEGDLMSDGTPTPRAHDGMAAFPGPDGDVLLVRNHEVRTPPSRAQVAGPAETAYDRTAGGGDCASAQEPARDH